jgi:hypothetical protein
MKMIRKENPLETIPPKYLDDVMMDGRTQREYWIEEREKDRWMWDVHNWFTDKGIDEPYDCIVLDTTQQYTLPKGWVDTFKSEKNIDLDGVPFIQIRFSDKRKSIPTEIKEYVMERIVFDMKKYWEIYIPFFYQQIGNVIRIFDTTKVDEDGHRIDIVKEEVV